MSDARIISLLRSEQLGEKDLRRHARKCVSPKRGSADKRLPQDRGEKPTGP